MKLADGSELHETHPFLRGGAPAPLDEDEIAQKFNRNTKFGGWPNTVASRYLSFAHDLFSMTELSSLKEFRQ